MATSNDRAILNSVFNPLHLPEGEESEFQQVETDEDLDDAALESIQLEVEGVKAAEAGELEKSIEFFGKAIAVAPRRPSPYNNRAQAFRLKGDVPAALEDLNNAINLGEGKGKSCCQAYCQRALIAKLRGQEARAKEDFEKAAQLGSPFAKEQLVQMNPYAALCNKMLSQMINKLQQGEDIQV